MNLARWTVLTLLAVMAGRAAAEVRLSGRVLDETRVAVPGAQLTLRAANSPTTGRGVLEAASDPGGNFAFVLPGAGDYLLRAEREGYFLVEDFAVSILGEETEITIILQHLREVHESVEVASSPPTIDPEKTSVEQRVSGNDIVSVPYPSTHSLQNAMRILPGAVVQDQAGEIHFNGGAANQTYWTLDGFNIGDPLTGRFRTQLNVEAARSLTLSTGRYSAEFGKGSAGAMAIETSTGDDRFRFAATNFVPGAEFRKGLTLSDWRPRVNVSGPIVKGRAWFFNSSDIQYSKLIIEELPAGQDRTTSYALSNLLRTQVNLTPSNILHSGFLITSFNAPLTGLGVLTPPESTVDLRSRQYFYHIKDQHYFRRGLILETGYAHNRTYNRQIPQGPDIYIFTPYGRRGNFFVDSRQWARRHQWLSNAILPPFSFAGTHQLKAGTDVNGIQYEQDTSRTGFEHQRLDGSIGRKVLYAGDGALQRWNFETAWYIHDAWRVRPNVLLEIGVRQDWDTLVRDLTTSPRFAFNWQPSRWENTKISGGYAIVYDATNLQIFARPLDQHILTTFFDREGNPERGPLVTLFTIDRPLFKAPRYQNWSLGVEQLLPGEFYLRANYLRRRGRDGFTFQDTIGGEQDLKAYRAAQATQLGGTGFQAIFGLRNTRRDEFDSVEITLRKTFRKQYAWLASYTRSRSVSNAALDISIDNPVLFGDNFGSTPWDSPNRLLSWGYFPVSKKYAISYMFEWRTGFPFSVEDEDGRIVGPVHSQRFPDFVELNLHLERKIAAFGNHWALRAGVINLTDSKNPTIVNNNIASPDFLRFAGATSRAFVARIRWLGKIGDGDI